MKAIVKSLILCLCVSLSLSGVRLTGAAEPVMTSYTCFPVFQTDAVEPIIYFLMDNGAETEQIAWHEDYDPDVDYMPAVGGEIEASLPAGGGNGFFHDNGYGIVSHGGNYYLVRINDDMTLDTHDHGLMATASDQTNGDKFGTWTINGRTISLPGEPWSHSSEEDADGILDKAQNFRFSKNYLNWIFFSVGAGSYPDVSAVDDGTDLTHYSRFYYAKSSMLAVANATRRRALIGIESFTANGDGTSNVQPYGYVYSGGALDPNYINNINNAQTVTYSPLAEGLASVADRITDITIAEECRQLFILVISPGVSSHDQTGNDGQYFPRNRDFIDDDGDGAVLSAEGKIREDVGAVPGAEQDIPVNYQGSTYLDDIAYYLYTHDAATDLHDADGDQVIKTYTVGFMASPATELFLINTSNNGNGNLNLYDTTDTEYAKYHYAATSPDTLAAKIQAAVNDIIERAGSGTAVSVLATSGEGEGNLVQAYFRPSVPSGETEVNWLGYLQSLWVDSKGNMREDSNGGTAMHLDLDKDMVVTYFLDSETGDTKIKRWAVSAENQYPTVDDVTDCEVSPACEIKEMNQISPLWEAGTKLQDRLHDRKIFTYIDKDAGEDVDEPFADDDPFDGDFEVITFHTDNDALIKPYLGVNHADWDYLEGTAGPPGVATRVTNLINYISGTDIDGLRTRTIDAKVWKLGDIIHSTPVTISKPVERFHALYGDESYNDYYNANLDRETVVYVGANDGMLHAFTSWEYNSATQTYEDPDPPDQDILETIGDEIWAYIPQSLLPHLKWLPSTSYTHVYYVDMKPKVFDAKILADDTHVADADADPDWGTILLVGFNLGGYNISTTGDFDYAGPDGDTTRNFKPSYVCMDVTDPRNPRLLWERSYDNLAMSASTPAVVKVKDNWFAVFGSGPETCGGTSTQEGHVFVVDLATGNPYTLGANDWLFQTAEDDAFMASPVSLDKGLNYSVDAVYLGETYLDGADWEGKVYKITIPWVKSLAGAYVYDGVDLDNYSDNPIDAVADKQWKFHELFDAGAPITSSPALSTDKYDNTYIYFGTGRYYNTDDKTNNDTQYLFGIKDPFFNPQWDAADDAYPGGGTAYYHNYNSSLTLGTGDLFDADSYVVTTTGLVDGDLARITGWSSLLGVVRNTEDQAANPDFYDGWMRSLTTSKERILTKPAILGGILFVPSFVPNSDVCGYGGSSYLYGLYYETGTSYSEAVFTPGTETVSIGGVDYTKLSDKISLGSGKASSLGIHVGQEEGATGFIQQSTGTVVTKTLSPAFNIKSGLIYWLEE